MKNEKIIFIHIPKTAGYTIGRCLQEIGVLKEGYGFSHHIARNIIKPHHRKYIIFAVVRNPYDRLYSIYEFYRTNQTQRRDIDKNVTFEQFIMTFEQKYYPKKIQFNTCFDFLTDESGNLMTTDIIKFENLAEEYNAFCKKYNIKNNLIKRNVNKSKNIDIDWSKLYNDEMKCIVENIFYNDFETFDYSYASFIGNIK
jgi:hypothetical protein|tara:strand:- start:1084 stop:1677 length:594 start_codon:yes stop_codon:yes gene_type:complete